MTERTLSLVMLGAIVVAAGAALAWWASRRFRRELGMREEEQEKTQDVGFIISAFQDVTRQLKDKEKELERLRALAESRAENILQCVSNGVIAFDEHGRVNAANRAAEELLGMSREEMAGRRCAELFENGDLCRVVQEALDDRITSRRMEISLVRHGERIWLGFNTALLTDRQGNSVGAILSFSDLTEVKRLQEQIELKERLTALGEMSAGIAHELRNPMAVIAGYLNLLAKKQDSAGQAVIRDIQAEIDGMNRIISDLLMFARPTSLNRSPVDLRDLLESCIDTVLQPRGEERRLVTDLDLPSVTVSADEVLLRQAVVNLLQNAVEAMPDGGTLSVRLNADRNVVIAVRDTGPGIPPEHIKKIFLPFFTTKDSGVGMGLALAHKVVTAHGGRIEVESGRSGGTTFTVVLPGT